MADQAHGKAFPKWKYPADGSAGKVVQNPAEEAALGPGWVDEPPPPVKPQGQLTLIALLVAQPDKIDATKKFLLELVDKTRRESGCVEYHLHQTENNPAEFTFYESWTKRADWDLHMTRPYVQAIAHRSKELLAVTPQIKLLTMISNREEKRM
jgi:quinol monooxygenase YgiN